MTMIARFGLDAMAMKQNVRTDVAFNAEIAVNPHMLFCGMSGAGKTYTLTRVVSQMQESAPEPIRLHVFDVHGDILLPGSSSVRFSESTQYGLNPLIVNDDPHFGGVRKRVQSFLNTINRTSRALGSKQEAVLRHLLTDVYSANGFYPENPSSWSLEGKHRGYDKKYPTLEDVRRYGAHKLKTLYLGSDQSAVAALEKLNKKVISLNGKSIQRLRPDAPETLDAEIEKLKGEAIRLYSDYVEGVKSGRELDEVIRYDSKDVLKSVVERIENLCGIGIFKSVIPPFDPRKPVWHYDLTALGLDERKLFVHFRLEEIFRRALHRGVQDSIRDVVVIDESHIYTDDDPDNILNTISKEARKFGISMIAASQSPTHFPDDFMASVATKVILGIDEMYWDGAARKLRLKKEDLAWITPQKTMLVQLKQRAETRSEFRRTLIQ